MPDGGFVVEGSNGAAVFTLKLHRGDGMTLLAMNWRKGMPPKDFVGFAIEYMEPGGDRFYALKNRIAFPKVATDPDVPSVSTRLAPIQKFRWVHFPRFAAREGDFIYRVSPVFMNGLDELSYGEPQEVKIELRRETHPGLGIADKQIKAENLGVMVIDATGRRRLVNSSALTRNVPKPFKTEPSGLRHDATGTRMHHKFVVLDFNRAAARVYLGSYNFSEDADGNNGENLVRIRDRRVATSYMIEALRIFDHYKFRVKQADAKTARKKLELQKPPRKAGEKPWWDEDWRDEIKIADRLLFA